MPALSAPSAPKCSEGDVCNILNCNDLRRNFRLLARLGGLQILTQWGCEVCGAGRIWITGSYWLNSRENWMLRRLLLIDRSLLFFKRSLLFSKRRLLLVVPNLGILGVESAESARTFSKLYPRACSCIMRALAREEKCVQIWK